MHSPISYGNAALIKVTQVTDQVTQVTDQVPQGQGGHPNLPPGGEAGGGSRDPIPSLDMNGRIYNRPNKSVLPRKHRRLYHRLKSGLAWHHGKRLRFLTLTTSPEGKGRPLGKDFNHLITRIRVYSPMRLLKEGWICQNELRRYFSRSERSTAVTEPLCIDYCAVQTVEGNGVLHVLYFGDWLPQAWISALWQDIHQSSVVDIRATKGGVRGTRRLTSYVLLQYVGGQEAMIRYSWSANWVYRGFVRDWRRCLRAYAYPEAILRWEWSMRNHSAPERMGGWQERLLDDSEIQRIEVQVDQRDQTMRGAR